MTPEEVAQAVREAMDRYFASEFEVRPGSRWEAPTFDREALMEAITAARYVCPMQPIEVSHEQYDELRRRLEHDDVSDVSFTDPWRGQIGALIGVPVVIKEDG